MTLFRLSPIAALGRALLVTSLLASLALVGCKKKDETAPVATTPPPATTPAPLPETTPPPASALTITAVDLGKSVDRDNKISAPTSTFAKGDTIYASVTTEGPANNKQLVANWTFQDGQAVGTETKMLTTTGPAVTEFHASKPDGWPVGRYKVEILVDGNVVQSREYEVK